MTDPYLEESWKVIDTSLGFQIENRNRDFVFRTGSMVLADRVVREHNDAVERAVARARKEAADAVRKEFLEQRAEPQHRGDDQVGPQAGPSEGGGVQGTA